MRQCTLFFSWWWEWCPKHVEIKFDNKHRISCNLLVSLSPLIQNFYMMLTFHSVFCIDLRIVSKFCFLQHKLVGFYTMVESLNCVVRINCLYAADFFSSLKVERLEIEAGFISLEDWHLESDNRLLEVCGDGITYVTTGTAYASWKPCLA